MNSNPLPRIPCELLRPIFEHLEDDKPSLCAISLCSSAFRQEAQRVLFSDVTNEQIDTFKFLRTVTRSPDRLALLVRAFTIPSTIIWTPHQSWAPIRDGLKAMTNLQYFCSYTDHRIYRGVRSAASILDGCTFQLERFEWNGTYRDGEEMVRIFIPLQHNLKHLGVHLFGYDASGYKEQTVPSICSQLSSLEGNWTAIYPILRGHKIQTLAIFNSVFPEIASDSEIISLAPALECIEALSLHVVELAQEHPERILWYCASLKVLELWDWSFFAEQALNMLPTMHSLHTLIISECVQLQNLTETLDALIWNVLDSPSINLERVDFRVAEDTYIRYSRSQGITAAKTKVSRWDARSPWFHERQ